MPSMGQLTVDNKFHQFKQRMLVCLPFDLFPSGSHSTLTEASGFGALFCSRSLCAEVCDYETDTKNQYCVTFTLLIHTVWFHTVYIDFTFLYTGADSRSVRLPVFLSTSEFCKMQHDNIERVFPFYNQWEA